MVAAAALCCVVGENHSAESAGNDEILRKIPFMELGACNADNVGVRGASRAFVVIMGCDGATVITCHFALLGCCVAWLHCFWLLPVL